MLLTPTIVISVGAVLGVVLIVQSWMLWRLLRAVGIVRHLEEKLSHFGDALTLLTETTEGGFRAVAFELDRASRHGSAAKKPVAPRPTSARMTAAVKRGRSVEEIAAAEQVSEGEVRLRLHLAKQAAQAKAARARRGRQDSSLGQSQTQETSNGALRA